jgi:hypothetical protein
LKSGTSTVLWLGGAFLLLAFPLHEWSREPAGDRLSAPVTPLDRTDRAAASQWLFLRRAATSLPRDAQFTVVAPIPQVELNLFMMSIGLLPRARPLPSSYYGVPASPGSEARYVLAYQDAEVSGPVRVRAVFEQGRVLERLAPK